MAAKASSFSNSHFGFDNIRGQSDWRAWFLLRRPVRRLVPAFHAGMHAGTLRVRVPPSSGRIENQPVGTKARTRSVQEAFPRETRERGGQDWNRFSSSGFQRRSAFQSGVQAKRIVPETGGRSEARRIGQPDQDGLAGFSAHRIGPAKRSHPQIRYSQKKNLMIENQGFFYRKRVNENRIFAQPVFSPIVTHP